MGYIKAHLMHGETLVYRARIHPFIFVQPVIILLLGCWYYRMPEAVFHYLGCMLLVLGASSFLQRLLIRLGADYGVTDRRLILKTGVVRRRAKELVHQRIEGLSVSQSVMGRLFGYGTIFVTTGGAVNTYTYVADPMRFKVIINECIESGRIRQNTNQ